MALRLRIHFWSGLEALPNRCYSLAFIEKKAGSKRTHGKHKASAQTSRTKPRKRERKLKCTRVPRNTTESAQTHTHTHTHTQQQQQTTQHSCKSSQKQNIGKYAQTGLPEGAQEHATPTKPPLRGSKKGEGVAKTTGHHEATRPRAHRKARLVRRARTAVQAPSRSNLLPSTLHNLNVSRPVL